jgi:AAA domain, putative AbiEii toxin, Type IV TA system/AAA domain
MTIRIQVRNFASFLDSTSFEIESSLNVFAGVNNSGKTALLWALSLFSGGIVEKAPRLDSFRHLFSPYCRPNEFATVTAEFSLPPSERSGSLQRLCSDAGVPAFPPYNESRETFVFSVALDPNNFQVGFLPSILSRYHSPNGIKEAGLFVRTGDAASYTVRHPFGNPLPNTWTYPPHAMVPLGATLPGLQIFRLPMSDDTLRPLIPKPLLNPIILSAHRATLGRSPLAIRGNLDINASNLAQVLATAQLTSPELPDGRERFLALTEEIRTIFPEILRVRTQTISNNPSSDQIEIVLDLKKGSTVPLSHSGTGVEQTLCLLACAILANSPSLFLIDEPHSYLHPAAERSLVRTLERLGREFSHIFCVTTHSPILTSHARRNIIAVKNDLATGSIATELKKTRDILAVLGIDNLDLFTYDKILFVEGPSDAEVFRAVLDHFDTQSLFDRIKLVPLSGDGKFKNRKNATQLLNLLLGASAAEAHVPVGFLFDSGDFSRDEQLQLRKELNVGGRSSGEFLARPELEDYLLNSDAIAEVLSSEAAILSIAVSAVEVLRMVSQCLQETNRKSPIQLEDCFTAVIPGRKFKKKSDSPRIAKQILLHRPDFLRPLYDELHGFLKAIPTAEQLRSQAHS